jgi:hypothetical protein
VTKRTPDEQVKARYAPPDPNAPPPAGRGGRGGGHRRRTRRRPAPDAGRPLVGGAGECAHHRAPARQHAGVAADASGAGRIPGLIVAQNGGGQIYDNTTPQPAGAILRNDDYGRIFRIIQDGTPVAVEFNIQNTYYPEGKTSYVTVARFAARTRLMKS